MTNAEEVEQLKNGGNEEYLEKLYKILEDY